jgi:hypothetical protein
MPTSDDTYRQALREKMGLKGNKPIKEEDVPQQPVASAKAPVAGGEVQTEEQLDPQAESIVNMALQFAHEEEKKHEEEPELLYLLKKFGVYLKKNKDKIAKDISK